MNALLPLVVVVPLLTGALLLAAAHAWPRLLPDIVSILVALFACAACGWLAARAAAHGPLTYWFGGWTPRPGLVLGIGFQADCASAAVAAFVAFICAASLGFAWGYFDEVHSHFHVLMLMFMGAMIGFCLTRDLFNLFVWFEVMSVAAYALTAYQLETDSLAGAMNFTVINSLASMLMLAGIGLTYARAGLLDFQGVAAAVSRSPADPALLGGFVLMATAMVVKGAVIPFQFWLSDAHAVAPSPISVIFSGVMVGLGLFGLMKLGMLVFAAAPQIVHLFRQLLLGLGTLSAALGALMAWRQRHLKRLLAFSTISHLGVMLSGIANFSAAGAAGFLLYLIGHGLVKGALFMVAGILLALRASVDEIELRGKGRGLAPVGLLMAFAALLLAGAPLGLLHGGAESITAATASAFAPLRLAAGAASWLAASVTGGAVLRAAGRIFLGWGSLPGVEAKAPHDKEAEKSDRPLWLMLTPCVALLILALVPAGLGTNLARHATASFAATALPPGVRLSFIRPLTSAAAAIVFAGLSLARGRMPAPLRRIGEVTAGPVLDGVAMLHDGLIGDYVIWLAVGLAVLLDFAVPI